jgi:hypothetical protein
MYLTIMYVSNTGKKMYLVANNALELGRHAPSIIIDDDLLSSWKRMEERWAASVTATRLLP